MFAALHQTGRLAAVACLGELLRLASEPELVRHVAGLLARLDTQAALDGDPQVAASVWAGAREVVQRPQPADWSEAVLKCALLFAMAQDLAERIGEERLPQGSGLVAAQLFEWAQQEAAEHPDRLGLVGRRLIAECSAQAQRVLTRHKDLAEALATGADDADELASTSELISALISASSMRMQVLGLQA